MSRHRRHSSHTHTTWSPRTSLREGKGQTFVLFPEEMLPGFPTRFDKWKWLVPIQAGARGRLATEHAQRPWGVVKSWGAWPTASGGWTPAWEGSPFPQHDQVVHSSFS